MTQGGIPGLDAILKAHAARSPDAIALIDPPDSARVTGETPRRWTYRQADRAVGAIAVRLREIGLAPGTVVGLQMPNVATGIIALLAIMRAGMVAAPLPLLWRRSDCVAALSAAGARAIVTCGRVSGFDHGALALEVAAELFPIRAVCGFGCQGTDGIVALDDLLGDDLLGDDLLDEADEPPEAILNQDAGSARVTLVTFETTANGIVPIARDTAQLLTAGRLIRQRSGISADAIILSTLPATTYAGVSAALVPWLLTGGTLALHHPFDPDLMRDQILSEHCNALVVPDAILRGLCKSDWLDESDIRSVIAVWRAPERLSTATRWTSRDVALIDVAAFGETALLAARRPPSGRTQPWPLGKLTISEGGSECANLAMTSKATLGVCGALAASPYRPYGTEEEPDAAIATGHLDTGYPCRLNADQNALIVTASPKGLITVGGYRFAIHEIQQMVRGIDAHGVLAALPHSLAGHRLAGHTTDRATMRALLESMGINPLLTAAFKDRAA